MDELFAKVYTDENITPFLSKVLRNKGFDCVSAHELKNRGLRDEQQLAAAVSMRRILITKDKNNFMKDSKALTINHFGIILVTKQYNNPSSLNKLAEKIINQYLNKYTSDEFINCVFYI